METQEAIQELNFDAYSDIELMKLHDELLRKVQVLQTENSMFEMYLSRVVPLKESERQDNQATNEQEQQQNTRRDKKKKGEKQKEQEKPILLTLEQKSEIATRELEELKDEIETSKEEWAKIMDTCKAELEEVDIRISESKKAMYEFKRDIVTQAINQRTGKVMAERVVRYFEDKIRSKDAIIEKLRLKNVTLKVHKNKLHLQLKQKEEMGEVLHAIDFDQLQIENKQYLQKIEERNKELLKLKMTAGNTVQILNRYKKKLQTVSAESMRLSQEIQQRQDLLDKLNQEEHKVTDEKSKQDKKNQWLVHQIEEYRAPDVLSYVIAKASQSDLEKKVRVWERKAEIASMQANRHVY
ncbi:hypothetical protein EDD86DRAFT_193075 [Gorgonomyces haynaldii]|nr:hypothetical protein EDD86DRAFT_193306 [Gorgonomyces haynaldii]KAI8906356.1 hypothetical protein EDD86DRAFT_193075 [Gorgonomyces haynaldii]